MRARLFSATILALVVPQQAWAAKAGPTDIVRVEQVSEPEISADGQSVVYTLEVADVAEDEQISHIWIAQWDGSGARRLTSRKGESESAPRFSPDGSAIAFISSRASEDDEADDAPARLWLLPRAGGEAYPLPGIEGSASDYAFSPDGKRLVLVVQDPKPKREGEAKDRPEPIVIDRYRFKEDGIGYLDNRRERLWLYDIASGKAERLTDGDFDEALPAWSPDGKRVAFVSRRIPDAERSPDFNIWTADVAKPGQAPKQITKYGGADSDPGFGSYPAWSPDGSQIAYLRTGDPSLIWYATTDLAVVPSGGGEERVLTETLDRNVLNPFWSTDGSTISFIVEDDGVQRLASVPAVGGSVSNVKSGEWVFSEPTVAPNGHVAMRVGQLTAPDEIYALDNGKLRALTSHNVEFAKNLELGKVERISVTSKDGTEVRGFIQTPPGYRKGSRVPTMLYIHGGPTSQFDVSFDIMREIFSGGGYAVITVNPRGSTGYGQAHAAGIDAAWGTVDVEDVLAAVDHAVAEGIADPDKLVIGGWSYGGMLTNYTIASDTRFKAAMSGASIGNILAGYGTDHYVYEYDVELGYPWENQEVWEKLSYPFLHNDRIVTPTLFMVGGEDVNVPTLATEQMYQGLRSRGIETRMVIYPGEFHGISRPSFKIDRLKRWLDWYDAHVK
ncbi:S9 family peptidase [Erythrobacter mangrovi]|uniref:S9 family peptidase n=1 Tax=Erythrobacter mangrovi TaxID=2739433 RepID=A0A7D4BAB0_9SPHN|nr:S9 family peptidase [Erythrobacter mangrovi]QKG71461.1 S9 family peptidase [Erythrobacter mangrovi]